MIFHEKPVQGNLSASFFMSFGDAGHRLQQCGVNLSIFKDYPARVATSNVTRPTERRKSPICQSLYKNTTEILRLRHRAHKVVERSPLNTV